MTLAAEVLPDDDPSALAAEELLRRRSARSSLHEFVRQAWPVMLGSRPFVDGWHIGAVCEHLEAVSRGQIRYLVINVPPRTTKSWTVSVFWPVWDWIASPTRQWLFTSYTQLLSTRDSLRARRLIKTSWYQARWGDRFSLLEDSDTKLRFDNDKGGYRIASSVDGTNTGEGGDIVVADDPNSARDTSEIMLETVGEWWFHVMASRLNDFRTGARVIIQQRVHESDLTGRVLADEETGAVHLMLPMEYEPDRKCVTMFGGKRWEDPRRKAGEILCPERFPEPELKKLKRELGSEYAIAGQLQQRPAPSEGGIIKKAWFRIWQGVQPPPIDFVLQSWDTAMSERKATSYSACTTWGVFKDEHQRPCVILLSQYRDRLEYPDLRRMAQRLALDYLDDNIALTLEQRGIKKSGARKPDIILVEAKNNGISLIQDLSRAGLYPHRFDPDKFGDKLQRVRLITHYIEQGCVWLPGKGPDFKKPKDYADFFREQCMPRGTEIVTLDGLKDIADIKVGDMVLTHRGRWRPVMSVSSRRATVLVHLHGKTLDAIRLTPEHPVYSPELGYNKKPKECRWIAAADLHAREYDLRERREGVATEEATNKPHDGVCLPICRSEAPIAEIDLREHLSFRPGKKYQVAQADGFVTTNHASSVPLRYMQPLDRRFGRFLGLYIAEGCMTNHQARWGFHVKEVEFAEEVRSFIAERLCGCSVTFSESRNCRTVTANLSLLHDFFRSFGHLAHNKCVPYWVWDAPDEFVAGLVDGWADGDGRRDAGARKVTTVSKTLAWQMRLLLARLGRSASVRKIRDHGTAVINGRTVSTRPSYTVEWREDSRNGSAASWLSDHVCYSLKEKMIFDDEIGVFNFSVLEDESYTTTGGVVHNCGAFPNAASRDLVDTMTQALLRLSRSGWIAHPDDVPPVPKVDPVVREAVY